MRKEMCLLLSLREVNRKAKADYPTKAPKISIYGSVRMYFNLLDEGGRGVTGFVLESQSRQSAKHFFKSSELGLPHPLQRQNAENLKQIFQKRNIGASVPISTFMCL